MFAGFIDEQGCVGQAHRPTRILCEKRCTYRDETMKVVAKGHFLPK
jgi:hypothetical protein